MKYNRIASQNSIDLPRKEKKERKMKSSSKNKRNKRFKKTLQFIRKNTKMNIKSYQRLKIK